MGTITTTLFNSLKTVVGIKQFSLFMLIYGFFFNDDRKKY